VILVRSIVFNLLFYLNTAALVLFGLVLLVFPRKTMVGLSQTWGRVNTWLMAVVCNTKLEMRGLEKLPTGGYIVAAKHQSTYETFALCPFIPDLTYIYKRELNWVPVFGWLLMKADQISVNRGARSAALASMTAQAKEKVAHGRQIIIFPEGTRTAPGAPPAYKYGIAHLYDELDVPCVPVALNAGLFWGRRSFMRYPGTIVMEVLEPIPPGMDKKDFVQLLTTRIEDATNRLLEEGRKELAARGITVHKV
jgi:1-acyl-sn-glycerol-3-phosphate acyltransferase